MALSKVLLLDLNCWWWWTIPVVNTHQLPAPKHINLSITSSRKPTCYCTATQHPFLGSCHLGSPPADEPVSAAGQLPRSAASFLPQSTASGQPAPPGPAPRAATGGSPPTAPAVFPQTAPRCRAPHARPPLKGRTFCHPALISAHMQQLVRTRLLRSSIDICTHATPC